MNTMTKTKKWVLFLSLTLFTVALFVAFSLWLATKAWNRLWSDVAYKTRYIECDPNELFAELERIFQIEMPNQIWEIKAARNYGSWDSKTSEYIARFCVEANNMEAFLSSHPRKVYLVPYTKQKDLRYVETKNHLAPPWFTELINNGKMGYIAGTYDCDIYIDTTVAQRYVVYLWGFGDLPLRDANSRDGNVVSDL